MVHWVSEDTLTEATVTAIEQFHTAFNRHDLEGVMALLSDDCVFENSYPPPDGSCHEGKDAVRAAWSEFFQQSPYATFEIEELFANGRRAVVRWLYRWIAADGKPGHVRGVDLMRVRDGKVSESLAYVKG